MIVGCGCKDCKEDRFLVKIKIREGTPRHDTSSLCFSCKKAQITRGEKLDHEIVQCGDLSAPNDVVRFKVTTCNRYLNAAHPSIREMEEIAWILCTDTKKQIGFVRHADLKREEQWKLGDDDW